MNARLVTAFALASSVALSACSSSPPPTPSADTAAASGVSIPPHEAPRVFRDWTLLGVPPGVAVPGIGGAF